MDGIEGVECATSGGAARWRPPRLWRALAVLARVLCVPVCRLRVTGEVPPGGGPLLLAANHIGALDPVVMVAACRTRRVVPRIMATGGLFTAPVVGRLLRHGGHIRVNRRQPDVAAAVPAARTALAEGSIVLVYPEGRIGLDPGGWPERGRTGVARLALATGTPVVPVAQWGAHLIGPWGSPRGLGRRLAWALLHRPVVRVHFGPPLDLAGTAVPVATDRIMAAITAQLRALRPGEPRLPAWIDPQRPLSVARSRPGNPGPAAPGSTR